MRAEIDPTTGEPWDELKVRIDYHYRGLVYHIRALRQLGLPSGELSDGIDAILEDDDVVVDIPRAT